MLNHSTQVSEAFKEDLCQDLDIPSDKAWIHAYRRETNE
jgi:hypothetical protein